MVRAATLVLVASLIACKNDGPPPPATGRQAQRGLPPADPADLAQAPAVAPRAADPSLPANHPPVPGQPSNHPPIEPAAPAGHGETAPHGADEPAGGPELSGEITVDPQFAAEMKAGDTIYLIARSVDPGGAAQRTILAAARLEVGPPPVTFRLTANNAMAAGANFAGDVEITARLDRDREVMSRAAGDIEGVVKAKIPAKDLKIVLDRKVGP